MKALPEIEPPVEKISRNASDYWEEDGIPALMAGAAYIVIVGSGLGAWALMVHSWPAWSWLTGSLALLWMPGAFIFLVWFWQHREEASEWMKARITYPRTGYVAPPSYWSEERARDPLFGRILDEFERHPSWVTISRRVAILWVGLGMLSNFLSTFHLFPRLEHALSAIVRWTIFAFVVACLPSAIKQYARKLKKNKLYWMEILAIPIFLLILLPHMMKHPSGLRVVLLCFAPGIYMVLRGALFLARYLYLYRIPAR